MLFPQFQSALAGQEAVQSVNGPHSKSFKDIILFAKTIVDSEPWLLDPKCLPIPWRSVEQKKKLKLAVVWNDPLVIPTPPVTRALKETVEKLKQAGHDIIEWDSTLHPKALQLLVSVPVRVYNQTFLMFVKGRMFLADGAKSMKALLEPTQEPWRPEMAQYEQATELGAHAMWQLHLERSELQRQFLQQWMSYDGLDAILCKFNQP